MDFMNFNYHQSLILSRPKRKTKTKIKTNTLLSLPFNDRKSILTARTQNHSCNLRKKKKAKPLHIKSIRVYEHFPIVVLILLTKARTGNIPRVGNRPANSTWERLSRGLKFWKGTTFSLSPRLVSDRAVSNGIKGRRGSRHCCSGRYHLSGLALSFPGWGTRAKCRSTLSRRWWWRCQLHRPAAGTA